MDQMTRTLMTAQSYTLERLETDEVPKMGERNGLCKEWGLRRYNNLKTRGIHIKGWKKD